MTTMASAPAFTSPTTPALARMAYATPASGYRDMEVLSASPERLTVVVFEHIVINLERARLAMEHKNIEVRVTCLARARGLITELLTTLDFEQGNGLASQLADLYQYMLYELVDVGQRGDQHVMRKLVSIATSLRDGFAGAAEQLASMKKSA